VELSELKLVLRTKSLKTPGFEMREGEYFRRVSLCPSFHYPPNSSIKRVSRYITRNWRNRLGCCSFNKQARQPASNHVHRVSYITTETKQYVMDIDT